MAHGLFSSLYSCADSEDSSSSAEDGDGGAFPGGGGAHSSDQISLDQPCHGSPSQDPPGPGHNQDEHCDPDEDDRDVPDMSELDDGSDSCDYPECEGLGTMSSHLAKLDSLCARGCADKFFKVHTAKWGPSMPRPGDYLHSARAGGADVRETRKRKAGGITRMAAESHAFCTSSNLSEKRSDAVLETFTNVSTFVRTSRFFCISFIMMVLLQRLQAVEDVPYNSFRTLDKTVVAAMLPDSDIKTVNLHEALDGDQPMEFHYVSILAEIKRMLGNPAYSGKMYTSFEYEAIR